MLRTLSDSRFLRPVVEEELSNQSGGRIVLDFFLSDNEVVNSVRTT